MGNPSKLWTPAFIKMCAGNMLLFASLYMLLPLFPLYLTEKFGVSFLTAGWVIGLFAISLFIFGPFFNYLVDTYRRKSICLMSLLAITAIVAGYPMVGALLWIVLLRIIQGVFAGLAMMSLGSTLAIDITPSLRRSDANTSIARCGRVGMAFGPMAGLLICQVYGYEAAFLASASACLLAAILIFTLHVPFRAPIGSSLCSTDRFFLTKGWLLSVNLILITAILGIILANVHSYLFYLMMASGIVIAIYANSLVFAEADIRARIVSGLILMVAALLLLATRQEQSAFITGALLAGTGLGLASFHFLLMLIRISEHCQRGTANTTYAFAWEIGVALGIFIGCAAKNSTGSFSYYIGIGIVILALALYLGVTNSYFLRHKRK